MSVRTSALVAGCYATVCLTSAAGAAASNSVAESAAPAIELQEIVVTAQRRDENLERTSVAVAVVSADELAKAQIVSETDLRKAVPGLQVRAGFDTNTLNYALRGQSQDAFSNSRPGVLPYINEIQIGGSGGSSAFYDLQSVQVIKGPQGTLFGRSATGGAVLFTTAKPTNEFGGYVSALGGDYSARKFEGALNVPLIDGVLLGRVAAFYQYRNGFQYNLYDGSTVGGLERSGARISLSANLGDRLHDDLVGDFFHSHSESTAGVPSGLMPLSTPGQPPYVPAQYLYAGTATPLAAATGIATLQAFTGASAAAASAFYNSYFANPKHPAGGINAVLAAQQARGPYVVDDSGANVYHANHLILTNSTVLELSDTTRIKNLVGYVNLRDFRRADTDGTPFTLSETGAAGLANPYREVSEELQLQGTNVLDRRLSYVTGVYFSDEKTFNDEESALFDMLFGGADQVNNYEITNRTYAAYAQGTYQLNDNGLAATLGARDTSEKVGKRILAGDSAIAALGVPPPAGYSYDQSTTYNRVSWQVGLQDQLNPNLLTYVVSRRAYKSGGYNGIVAPKVGFAETAGDAYRAEELTDLELGIKFEGHLGDVATRANLAVFNNWLKNSQRVAFTLNGANAAALTVNVPNGATRGLELSVDLIPVNWLSMGGAFNYTHASFSADEVFANGAGSIFDQVPDTPKLTGSAYIEGSIPVGPHLTVRLRADEYAQSKSFNSPQSINNAGTIVGGYASTDFRVILEDQQAGWSLEGLVKNAFNRVYYIGGLPVGEIYQLNTLTPADPRTYTVEARYHF